jgi:site-specific DNA-cytosine methylase
LPDHFLKETKTSYVDNPFQSPVILSICTGMRGIETGIESVIGKLKVAAYVEIEAFVIFNLVKQMEQGLVDPTPIWSDIKTFPARQFHGKVHGIIGGYPCQPFSVAGKQKGTDDPRHLWPFIKRDIAIINPYWCYFENVANHLNIGYREVRSDLEEMGFAVEEGIYTAQEIGAPHLRKRLFILAIKTMADTNSSRYRTESTGSIEQGREVETAQQREERYEIFRQRLRSWIGFSSTDVADTKIIIKREQTDEANTFTDDRQTWNEPVNRSSPVGDTKRAGLQGFTGNVDTSFGQDKRPGSPGSVAATSFPMGQGNQQYEWEAPRVIKSGMGCTIDGYNFREDILRMLGNGVISSVSALAFYDLLMKHCK